MLQNKSRKYYLFNIDKGVIEEVKYQDVMDKLYYLEYRVPTVKEVADKTITPNVDFFKDKPEEIVTKIKYDISRVDYKVPLYDVYTDNIYLIERTDVYPRVMFQSYRFPEEALVEDIRNRRDKYLKDYKSVKIDDKLLIKKMRKLNLMIQFMDYFEIPVLYETYIKVFYKYSNPIGRQRTVCKNPSFIPQFQHIDPYLTRDGIINLALNNGYKLEDKEIEHEDIKVLCKQIRKLQISAQILLNHYNYIVDNGYTGLVRYYTLQGSFSINRYLRGLVNHKYRDRFLEELIEPMWKLVNNAPAFDKDYFLYRFIKSDSHLSHLKIGDIYEDDGFISTSRDPFYKSELYSFGFILMKIRVPGHKRGTGLCLETVSYYPEEQEVIFAPKTKFRLLRRDNDVPYYHTSKKHSSMISVRYEFEWIGNSDVIFEQREEMPDMKAMTPIDIIKANDVVTTTLEEKIDYFNKTMVNRLQQFMLSIGGKTITVKTEWYYGTDPAYEKFYALQVDEGFSIYSIYRGHILFFIEIGVVNNVKQMCINYHLRYTSINVTSIIGDEELMFFYSALAYFFDIPSVIIYTNYLSCDTEIITESGVKFQREYNTMMVDKKKINIKQLKMIDKIYGLKDDTIDDMDSLEDVINLDMKFRNGSYCYDFYQYYKTGYQRYKDSGMKNIEIMPMFSFHDLDTIGNTSPERILNREDQDELYQVFKVYREDHPNTIKDFYIWLKENKCYLLDLLIDKIDRITKNNPFKQDVYILDPFVFLYGRNYVSIYPPQINYANVKYKQRVFVKKNVALEKYHELEEDMTL